MADQHKDLPTFISLHDAAQRTGLSESCLRNLIEGGKLTGITIAKEVFVAEHELAQAKTKAQLIAEKFPHLQGQGITLSEAADKYDVPRSTVETWFSVNGYIQTVEDSYPMKVDEAEVAYCAEAYHARREKGIHSRIPLLDEQGLPNVERKHPELAEKRRQKRQRLKPG